MALTSSWQDAVVSFYLFQTGTQYQTNQQNLINNVLAPLPKFKWFVISGSQHCLTPNPSNYTIGGVNLWTWLTQEVTDNAAWVSRTQ
jgi:hypothetical protein